MKAELHAHSSEVSVCGWLTVEEVSALYGKAGYDAVVITNHFNRYTAEKLRADGIDDFHRFYHDTLRKARSAGEKHGILVLGGYELRFDGSSNDYLVYGMTEEQCRDCEALFSSTPEEFGRFARENGILFYQAHPFRNGMTVVDPECLFGFEVRNSHPRHDSRNDIALAWAEKFALHKIGGSDCHRIEDVAGTFIETQVDFSDMSQLVHILKNDLYTINAGKE